MSRRVEKTKRMPKKPKKPEEYAFPLAVGLTMFLSLMALGAIGTDMYHAAHFLGQLYAGSI